MSISTRFLLGGFYLANLLAFFIGSITRPHFAQMFSHGHEFLSRGNQFALLVVLSAAVSVLAVTFTRLRMLALAAAAINAFYAVGGLLLFGIFFIEPGGFGKPTEEDPFVMLCVIFVPAVATMAFYGSYRRGGA
jgi:hypothetical protein